MSEDEALEIICEWTKGWNLSGAQVRDLAAKLAPILAQRERYRLAIWGLRGAKESAQQRGVELEAELKAGRHTGQWVPRTIAQEMRDRVEKAEAALAKVLNGERRYTIESTLPATAYRASFRAANVPLSTRPGERCVAWVRVPEDEQ